VVQTTRRNMSRHIAIPVGLAGGIWTGWVWATPGNQPGQAFLAGILMGFAVGYLIWGDEY
jgi:hypothetical protein